MDQIGFPGSFDHLLPAGRNPADFTEPEIIHLTKLSFMRTPVLSILLLGLILYASSCKKSNSGSSGNEDDAQGAVSTLAGDGNEGFADGPAATAEFSGPTDLALDNVGNIYVTDYFKNRIRKITADGTVSTLAGNSSFCRCPSDHCHHQAIYLL
jgi:hypothetical protein